ncbi:F-box protein-like protein, partial [Tanacetum coccineum]
MEVKPTLGKLSNGFELLRVCIRFRVPRGQGKEFKTHLGLVEIGNKYDYIPSIFDDTLLRVLSKFEEKGEIFLNSLVSKKWLNLGGGLVRKVKILKLADNVDGFYSSLVSDIGLTILAQGCKRLVKLELRGCEGSYDGIKAIRQCYQMLEELTFCDHRMDDGWLSGVSYCENLKSLRLVSCKRIDGNLRLDEHLGSCRILERFHMERCQSRDKESLRAAFLGGCDWNGIGSVEKKVGSTGGGEWRKWWLGGVGSNNGILGSLFNSLREILATKKAAKAFDPPPRTTTRGKNKDMTKSREIKATCTPGEGHQKGKNKASNTQMSEWKKSDKETSEVEAPILMIQRNDPSLKRKTITKGRFEDPLSWLLGGSIHGIWE